MKVVEVFADVWCPFTHVGLRRIVARREMLGRSDVVFHVRAWPLELENGKPFEADFIAEEVDALRAQVAGDLFTGFEPARFPSTTLPALDLAARAYTQDLLVGQRVSLALRDAMFENGANVAAPATLAKIADACGVRASDLDARATVLADWSEGKARGVVGSPHFFLGDENFFCPSLAISRRDGHLEITGNAEAFEAFLARIFN